MNPLVALIRRWSEFYRQRGGWGWGAGTPAHSVRGGESCARASRDTDGRRWERDASLEPPVCLSVAASTMLRGAIEPGCRVEKIKKKRKENSWQGNWKGNITVTGTITVVGMRLPLN